MHEPETHEISEVRERRLSFVPPDANAELGDADTPAHWAGRLNLFPRAQTLAVKFVPAFCELGRSTLECVETDGAHLRRVREKGSEHVVSGLCARESETRNGLCDGNQRGVLSQPRARASSQ